jgi:hypothetical protein
MNLEKQLLTQLIEKYESSKAFSENSSTRRRILLNFENETFEPYQLGTTEQRTSLHEIVHDLKTAGFIDFSWVRGQKERRLHQVWLKIDRVDDVYERLGRMSPQKEALIVLKNISRLENSWRLASDKNKHIATSRAWIGIVINEIKDHLVTRKCLGGPLPENLEQALAMVQALTGLVSCPICDPETIPEHVFSFQTFGNTETFEKKVRSHLAYWVRQYHLPGLLDHDPESLADLDLDETDLLNLIGLARSPEILEWSGPLLLHRDNQTVDFSFFNRRSTLSAAELENLHVTIPETVSRLLFIEKQVSFHWLIQRKKMDDHGFDTLLVYHGSCFSPARGQFFQRLKEGIDIFESSHPNALPFEVLYWGDIDLGGFLSFNRLKEMLFPDLKPWHMDRSDLQSCLNRAQPIDKSHAGRLDALRSDKRFSIFHPVIELALERNVRLEQEALLYDL